MTSCHGGQCSAAEQMICLPPRASRRCLHHKYEPRNDEPERPGDVGDRDDRARELPALLLEAADELQRTEDEEEPDETDCSRLRYAPKGDVSRNCPASDR